MIDWLKGLFGGESAEEKQARACMLRDAADPRRAFAWGVLAMAEKYDPGYLPSLARTVISDWYGIASLDDLMALRAETLSANDHVAYNQFRLAFVARAAFGAGLIDEATSWQLTTQHVAEAQAHYGGWREFGQGYIEGHLAYRAQQGDDAAELARQRENLTQVIQQNEATTWAAAPWATRLS